MDERAAEEFREFMHGRWPSMVRLAYGLTGDQACLPAVSCQNGPPGNF